jgi:hypothetical protein
MISELILRCEQDSDETSRKEDMRDEFDPEIAKNFDWWRWWRDHRAKWSELECEWVMLLLVFILSDEISFKFIH